MDQSAAQFREDEDMKKSILAAAILMSAASAASAADPIFGLWKTQPDEGVFYHVQMKQCGASICGVFMKKFENGTEVEADVIGKNAVFDMQNQGGGEYEGKAWRPKNQKTYKGKGSLNGDTMEIGGCILGGIICSKQNWVRVK